MLNLSPEHISEIYQGKKKHKEYDKCVDFAWHIEFHMDGYYMPPPDAYIAPKDNKTQFELPDKPNPYFMRLIDMIRPAESAAINTYRRITYLPVTKNPVHKVYNVLRKILKSSDWAINWPKSETNTNSGKKVVSTGIPDKESLQEYCENMFPFFDSIENWYYQEGMKRMLCDPNGLIAMMPIEWPTEVTEAEFVRPFPYTIPSKDVYEYKEGEVMVFKSPNVHVYKDLNGKERQSMMLIIATKDEFFEVYKESNTRNDTTQIVSVWEHNIGYLPCWKMGGEVMKFNGKSTLYESFLSPMLADLDNCARLHSDTQADIIQHVNNIFWYYANQKCKICDGSGYVNPNGKRTVCSSCQGGYIQASPFNNFMLTPKKNQIGQETDNPPTPPMGYIEKNTDITELLIKLVETTKYMALSSVNMEYLGEAPLTQSGTAKAYDQDAGNSFLGRVAYHIVEHILNNIYWFTNEMRNKLTVTNYEKRQSLTPTINIPSQFDFITEQMQEQKLISLKKADVSPEIIAEAEEDYIQKKYYNKPELIKMFQLKRQHDPFPHMDAKDISDLETSGTITKKSAVKSLYIDSICEELLHEEKDFLNLDFGKVKELIDAKTGKILESMSTEAQVNMLANQENLQAPPNAVGKNANGDWIDDKDNVITPVEDPAHPADVPGRLKNKQSNNRPAKIKDALKYS